MVTTLLKVKNRAYSKLAAAITAGGTTLTVTAGEGANFPSTYPFHLTIEDEIVSCTNRATDTLTIARAQQSTTAAAHANKTYVALNITAKSVTDLNTAVNTIEATVVSAEIVLLDNKRIIFGTGSDISMKWDGTDFHIDVAGATAQLNIGATSHLAYVKLVGSLAITQAELSVTMAKGDPAASFTNTSTGLGLRVNRVATSAGNIIEIRRNGTNIFYIEGDTARSRFVGHLKAMAGFVVEAGPVVFGETGGGDVTFRSGDTANYRVYFDHDADANRGRWNFGQDDYGVDVKFWGNTTGKYMLWDASADKLLMGATLDAAGNMLDNLGTLRSRAGDNSMTILARKAFANQGTALYIQTYNASNAATSRVTITGGYNIATIAFADSTITHAVAMTATSGGEEAFKMTITDAATQTSGMNRAFVVDLTVSGAKSGTAHSEGASIDLTLSGNTNTAYGQGIWVTDSGGANHVLTEGLNIYLENMGAGTLGAIIGLDIGINSTNVATGRHAALRMRNHSGTSKTGILFEGGFITGIDLGGTGGGGIAGLYTRGIDFTGSTCSVAEIDLDFGKIIFDQDGDTDIHCDVDDELDFKLSGSNFIIFASGVLRPGTTNQVDLGSSSKQFKDIYIDGVAYIDSFGETIYINDTANTKMTMGLTINQAGNDDEIFSLKSSDVAHGITDATETDTYFYIKKYEADYGGVNLVGLKQAGGVAYSAFNLVAALAENVDTTKSTAGRAMIQFAAYQYSGTSITNMVAGGNLFGVLTKNSGGSFVEVFLVSEPGDLWLSGGITTAGVYSQDDTTNSTSATTGSIHTDGGIGIAEDLYCAKAINTPDGMGADGEQLTSGGDNVAMDWAGAGSLAKYKDIKGYLDPDEALNKILGVAKVSLFNYRDKTLDGGHAITTGDFDTLYAGVLGEEAPWVMHYKGNIFSPVSAFGYTVAAFQAIVPRLETVEEKIERLENELAELKASLI